MTKQSRAKLMCITLLIQHEVIYDMQTLTESIDELTHMIRGLSKEEVSIQWEEFCLTPLAPLSALQLKIKKVKRRGGKEVMNGGVPPFIQASPPPVACQRQRGNKDG